MPLYFAYGANMDVDAMRQRCPSSRVLGRGRLPGHRFVITADGYASVRPAPGVDVHGLVWRLALADVAALDAFEDVAGGLYRRLVRPVLRPLGAVQALLYVGTSTGEGPARPHYLECVIASGEAAGLPAPYLRHLHRVLRQPAPASPWPRAYLRSQEARAPHADTVGPNTSSKA